jgi:hypothetical protein
MRAWPERLVERDPAATRARWQRVVKTEGFEVRRCIGALAQWLYLQVKCIYFVVTPWQMQAVALASKPALVFADKPLVLPCSSADKLRMPVPETQIRDCDCPHEGAIVRDHSS